jgi:hypothetical protein
VFELSVAAEICPGFRGAAIRFLRRGGCPTEKNASSEMGYNDLLIKIIVSYHRGG